MIDIADPENCVTTARSKGAASDALCTVKSPHAHERCMNIVCRLVKNIQWDIDCYRASCRPRQSHQEAM